MFVETALESAGVFVNQVAGAGIWRGCEAELQLLGITSDREQDGTLKTMRDGEQATHCCLGTSSVHN